MTLARTTAFLLATATVVARPVPAPAAAPFMSCDAPSAVAAIRPPVDATHAGAGHVTLADGATFELSRPDADAFTRTLHAGDRVQLCYGPPQRFADAGPTARMAIAGLLRTGDALYTLAYPAQRIAPALAKAIAGLAGSGVPLLVPTTFDGSPVGRGTTIVALRGAFRYVLRFDLAPNCDGANVCSLGSIAGSAVRAGEAPPPADLGANVRTVRLSGGIAARYSESRSGASDGGNSRLSWRSGDARYVITSRISSAASLVATADSAIANGPLEVPAEAPTP